MGIKVILGRDWDGKDTIKWKSTVKKLRETLDDGFFNESFYDKIKDFQDDDIVLMVV